MRLLLILHKFLQRIQKATSTATTSSSQTLLNVPSVALSSPNRSSMAAASHTFPTTLFTSPLRSLSHFKPKLGSNPIWVSSPLRAFVPLSSKISFGFSNSRVSGLGDGSSGIRGRGYSGKVYASAVTEKSIHDFTVKDIDGKDVSLSKFKGKVLLIVNVASRCGLTSSNYTELAQLYEKYKAQGFEILAFPCNQFGSQEPGTNTEIKQFACTRFKAEYPIFDKIEVNGPNTAPVYQFLKSSAGGFLGDLIKWNFEKFLVNKDGKVVERYPPTTSPFQIEKDIQKALAAA